MIQSGFGLGAFLLIIVLPTILAIALPLGVVAAILMHLL